MFGLDIIDASLLPAILIAALAGVLSFLSPCVLPIVPPYLAYVGGISMTEMGAQGGARRRVAARTSTVGGVGIRIPTSYSTTTTTNPTRTSRTRSASTPSRARGRRRGARKPTTPSREDFRRRTRARKREQRGGGDETRASRTATRAQRAAIVVSALVVRRLSSCRSK